MKLEKGMYVRYVAGFHHNESDKPIVMIGKVLRADNYINLDTFFGGGVFPTNDFEKFIKGEPSHNIIDLIEVGDYVNGHKVINVYADKYKVEVESDELEMYTWEEIFICEFKTIVTKEQFESMSYKVGD